MDNGLNIMRAPNVVEGAPKKENRTRIVTTIEVSDVKDFPLSLSLSISLPNNKYDRVIARSSRRQDVKFLFYLTFTIPLKKVNIVAVTCIIKHQRKWTALLLVI